MQKITLLIQFGPQKIFLRPIFFRLRNVVFDILLEKVKKCFQEKVKDITVAKVLLHFVYDGVYASKEERIRGGGCLDITKNVSELLGLSNELTGN